MYSPSKLHQTFTKHRVAAQGFSLVEVVIALGILTFALVSLLALIPVSLNTYQEASLRTVQVTILDQLTAKTQKTPYNQLTDLVNQNWVFDRSGYEVGASSPDAQFVVTLAAVDTPIPSTPGAISENLTTFKVSLSSIGKPGQIRTFNFHVANAGL